MANLFYGIGLNFGKSQNGYFSPSSDKKLIYESLYSILFTRPGERIHEPNFGVGIELYLFEPNDDILEDTLKDKIVAQVSKYEPGVDIESINFDQEDEQLKIQIIVRMKDFGTTEKLNYSLKG